MSMGRTRAVVTMVLRDKAQNSESESGSHGEGELLKLEDWVPQKLHLLPLAVHQHHIDRLHLLDEGLNSLVVGVRRER